MEIHRGVSRRLFLQRAGTAAGLAIAFRLPDVAAFGAADGDLEPNAYQQFDAQLSPYGAWEDVPEYGHVWVPSPSVVGYDFTPYASGGHWLDSDYGWAWDSDWD